MPFDDLQFPHGGGELFGEGVIDPVLHQNAVGADAGLARCCGISTPSPSTGGVQIGIVEHHEGRVAAQLHGDFLDVVRALAHQLTADFGGAGESELAHDRVGGDLGRRFRRRAGDHAKNPAAPRRVRPVPPWPAPNRACEVAGLTTIEQPAASAGPALRVIMAAGKFHGVIAAVTPMGSFITMMRLSRVWPGMVSP